MTDIVPIPALRPSSEFPTNADRNAGVFNPKAFNWANSSRDMAADMSAIADAARTNAIATNEIAVDAKNVTESNKTAAQNAQNAAELAAINAAGSAAFYGSWSELTGALDMPATVTHDDKDWRLVRNLIDVTAAEPGVSDAWEEVKAGLVRQTRTANVALDASARGQLIDIVSGTFTQTFAATATLGGGWWCYLKNSGSGDITLDPNASELIDGLTSYIMYPGEVRLVQCDGTALRSVVLNSFYKVFTASGTFIKPPGYSGFGGELFSGGYSGIRNNSNWAYGGNGGGGFPFTLPSTKLLASTSVIVGAGGVWSLSAGTTNSPGGTSSFGPVSVSADGPDGLGITTTQTQRKLYTGGTYVSGAIADLNRSSASSTWGGGAGATYMQGVLSNSGGISMLAGRGGGAAQDGQIPSGGGGSAPDGVTPGNGARGELRIWGII